MLRKDEVTLGWQRYQGYMAIFEPVTDGHLEAALLIKEKHFHLDVFERRYKGNEEKIKRYLIMQRWYLFNLNTWFYDVQLGEPKFRDEVTFVKILIELCEDQEFRDFHHRNKMYYPNFGKWIENEGLAKTKHRKAQQKILQRYLDDELLAEECGRIETLDECFSQYKTGEREKMTEEVLFEMMDRYWEDFENFLR